MSQRSSIPIIIEASALRCYFNLDVIIYPHFLLLLRVTPVLEQEAESGITQSTVFWKYGEDGRTKPNLERNFVKESIFNWRKISQVGKLLRSRIQHLANFLILEQYIGIACQSFGNVHGKKGLGFFPDGKKGRFSSWWGRKMKQHESIHISYDFTLSTIFHKNKVFLK